MLSLIKSISFYGDSLFFIKTFFFEEKIMAKEVKWESNFQAENIKILQ
jgi:hypothetical protein